MRTFRNVTFFMFAMGSAMFACGICSAHVRSFEEVSGETEVGRGLLAPEPRPLPPLALALRTRPAGTQTESQLEPATSADVILSETGHFLLLYSLQLWQQLQRCCQTCARVPLFFFIILLPFCGNSSPWTICFLGKRTVTSERSRKETRGRFIKKYWTNPQETLTQCYGSSHCHFFNHPHKKYRYTFIVIAEFLITGSYIEFNMSASYWTSLCGRDGRTICGPQRLPKSTCVSL